MTWRKNWKTEKVDGRTSGEYTSIDRGEGDFNARTEREGSRVKKLNEDEEIKIK